MNVPQNIRDARRLVDAGATIVDACGVIGISPRVYENWRNFLPNKPIRTTQHPTKAMQAELAHTLIQLRWEVKKACKTAGISRQGYYNHFAPAETAAGRTAASKERVLSAIARINGGDDVAAALKASKVGDAQFFRYAKNVKTLRSGDMRRRIRLALEMFMSGGPMTHACKFAGVAFDIVTSKRHDAFVREVVAEIRAAKLAAAVNPTSKSLTH